MVKQMGYTNISIGLSTRTELDLIKNGLSYNKAVKVLIAHWNKTQIRDMNYQDAV